MLYHWNMIEPHDKQIHRESMLMPLVFTSYENCLLSSKSFQEGLNWMEVSKICQKPTKCRQVMFCEAVKVDMANSKDSSFNNTITSTLSLITVLFEDLFKAINIHKEFLVKKGPLTIHLITECYQYISWICCWVCIWKGDHQQWWGQCTPKRIVAVVWGVLYLWFQGILQKFALYFDGSEQDHIWK